MLKGVGSNCCAGRGRARFSKAVRQIWAGLGATNAIFGLRLRWEVTMNVRRKDKIYRILPWLAGTRQDDDERGIVAQLR
jgi:hypothetical protein